jgi:hypothetical protein
MKLSNKVAFSICLAALTTVCFAAEPRRYIDNPGFGEIVEKLKVSDCNGAIELVKKHYTEPDESTFVLASIYEFCKKDMDTANAFLTLSARYGSINAQEKLAERRLPIPAPDLRPKQSADSSLSILELLSAAMQGYAAVQAGRANANNSINCTSYRIGKDFTRTTCD